ncbi:Hypothetical predicted protein [Pelobates cultripes]|uniref:Uncharacterized protein n=1 Tax=Pelobates cultripes TaxID=61616 RepID=A0AAD1W0S5_PELCU|nr:Hypothetical predicted protein [Pelobates cultripes]
MATGGPKTRVPVAIIWRTTPAPRGYQLVTRKPAESTENESTAYPQQQDQTQVTAGRLEHMLTMLGNGRKAADTYPDGRSPWLGVRPRSPPRPVGEIPSTWRRHAPRRKFPCWAQAALLDWQWLPKRGPDSKRD